MLPCSSYNQWVSSMHGCSRNKDIDTDRWIIYRLSNKGLKAIKMFTSEVSRFFKN